MKLQLALAMVALFLGRVAAAGPETYCVGGYDGTPPLINAACDTVAVQRMHNRWHLHMFLRGPGGCLACYDEQDNTCKTTFLRSHPEFSDADAFDCAVVGPLDDLIHAHVIDGQPQVASPAPPAKLAVGLEDLSPGPYTAGDTITAVGAVRDQDGNLRSVSGGSFTLTDASGKVQTVRGERVADGSVRGRLLVPASEGVRVVFTPDPPHLAPGESLSDAASEPVHLDVSICAYNAAIVAPGAGESLVSGQPAALRAVLMDTHSGARVAPLAGASLVFTAAPAGQMPMEIAATVDGDGFSATWMPPASPEPLAVQIYAAGRAGDRVICHAAGEAVKVSVSDLGLGFDLSGLPDTCYVGLPCRGTLRLVRPEAGRAAVDGLLLDPTTEVVLLSGGEVLSTQPPTADDRYGFEEVASDAHNASWSLEIRRGGATVSSPVHEVRVRPALVLTLPEEIDFGTVAAGSDLFSACQKLDFSRSTAAGDHRWQLSLEGLTDCKAQPMLAFRNAAGDADAVPISADRPIEALDPARPWLDLCLDVPRCAGEQSPAGAVLRVTPLTPEFAALATPIRLKWRVEERSWLDCQGAWLWPSVGALGGLFLIAGYVRPRRFRPEAAIAVAGSEKGLRNAAWTTLLDCPGSSAGFFRDARLGLNGDGTLSGRVRDALLILRATEQGTVLDPRTGVEVQDRRTRRWSPVEARGHMPTRGAIYRAGGTYFRVEGG